VAYSYIRFSHPDQAKGDSLRRQTEAARAWCVRNGLCLDESTTLRDLGRSAYTGKHRSNPDRHALAAFLKLIEQSKVPRGSFLIIENLDRLSREDERSALRLWMDILDQGVNIVQLHPETIFRHEKSDMVDIMRTIIELSRGHGESARKSERNGAAWAERRRKAREEGAILTRRLPAWIEERSGKGVLIPERAATIKRIFALAAGGYGCAGIVKKLTDDKVPSFGPSGHWTRTYVAVILKDRRALGELQPRLHAGKPDGEPLKGYFPAAVTERDWQAARAGAAQRRRRVVRGRPWADADDDMVRARPVAEAANRLGRSRASVRSRRSLLARREKPRPKNEKAVGRYINVFSGLLRDARDGGNYYVATRSSPTYGTSWRVLLNMASAEGRAPARSFPFLPFERAVLSLLAEINPHEILNGDDGPDETLVLSGELARVEAKIAELEAELLQGDVAALAKVLRQLEAQKRELAEKLAVAREKAANPLSEMWGEAQSLIDALDAAAEPHEVRVRLRAALRRIAESVWLLPIARGRSRLCAVQIWFAGGKKHRDYLILCRPPHAAGRGHSAGGGWRAISLTTVAKPGGLDLRQRGDARKLEAELERIDFAELWREIE
jgi:hypothetical protein